MNEPLYQEHAGLIQHAERLLGHMASVKSRLQFGEAHISWHSDWADSVLWLHGRLRLVRLAIDQNEYPSAFALTRTALEHHLFDRLFFLADRAALVQRLEPADDQVAYVRQLDQLKADPASDLEDWHRLPGKRRYELIRTSPAFENAPTQRMSYLNLLLKEFDPFHGKTRHQERLTRRFTAITEMEQYAKQNEEFRQDYFTSDRLRRNLEVADLATEHERMQIDVHLDFLSAFVHGSPASYDAIYAGRKRPAGFPPYDHYCSELALLYVIRIAGEELFHFERALSRPPVTPIRDWTTTARDIELADRVSAHFWFLGRSGPHHYDRVRSVEDAMFEAAGEPANILKVPRIDPASLELEHIHYEDPLKRIVDMHSSYQEMTTGTWYQSPWPRDDAALR